MSILDSMSAPLSLPNVGLVQQIIQDVAFLQEKPMVLALASLSLPHFWETPQR